MIESFIRVKMWRFKEMGACKWFFESLFHKGLFYKEISRD